MRKDENLFFNWLLGLMIVFQKGNLTFMAFNKLFCFIISLSFYFLHYVAFLLCRYDRKSLVIMNHRICAKLTILQKTSKHKWHFPFIFNKSFHSTTIFLSLLC